MSALAAQTPEDHLVLDAEGVSRPDRAMESL
jgi:hypothetical protein